MSLASACSTCRVPASAATGVGSSDIASKASNTTTWTKSKLSITGAGVETGESTQEKETTTLEADSPKECDAWDVWVEELKSVRELLRKVWTVAETVPV
jgi:hypothetical protein